MNNLFKLETESNTDCTQQYKTVIANLAEKLYSSGILKDVDLDNLTKTTLLWDNLVKIKPEVQKLAYEVEEQFNYELSFNQCCNAVNWVYKFNKEEWQHLL